MRTVRIYIHLDQYYSSLLFYHCLISHNNYSKRGKNSKISPVFFLGGTGRKDTLKEFETGINIELLCQNTRRTGVLFGGIDLILYIFVISQSVFFTIQQFVIIIQVSSRFICPKECFMKNINN